MENQKSHTRNRTSGRGFTIIECLISLAITAVLMVSLGVAFNASITNYRENEQMFRTINSARQALTRITSQLRTGHYVDPAAPTSECSFFTDANDNLTYEFRSEDKKLYLITNSDGHEYTLCDHVSAASFIKTPDGHGDCKSVQVSLTIENGGRQRSLAAAAVIRRNLEL
jgi:prepilin-type N-terminal cleavage/methylation domain-containing protein